MKKRLVSLLLAAVMAVTLVGCGNDTSGENTNGGTNGENTTGGQS